MGMVRETVAKSFEAQDRYPLERSRTCPGGGTVPIELSEAGLLLLLCKRRSGVNNGPTSAARKKEPRHMAGVLVFNFYRGQ